MKLLKTVLILLVIVIVFGAAMFGLNFITGPIIAENNKGEFGNDTLLELAGLPEQVTAVYQKEDGSFAIQLQTVDNYEKDPIKLTLLVASDGKITELKVDEYTDSIDVREKDASFIPSFTGKDSALADVNLVSGCTFSSKSIKEAVEAGLGVLISNNLITAGVKGDDQILMELIPTVFSAMGTPVDAGVSTGNITAAYKSDTGVGYAYIVKDGETSVLAIVNAMGACKVYDTTGTDVTASNEAVITEVMAHFDTVKTDYATTANSKLAATVEGAANVTALKLETYSTIVYGASFEANGTTYYGFYSRAYGFAQMDIYIVLDENGAIVKSMADAYLFDKEYFELLPTYPAGFDENTYKDGFTGLTQDTFGDENVIVNGATMTSNAVKTATKDAFDAFNEITKGGEQ